MKNRMCFWKIFLASVVVLLLLPSMIQAHDPGTEEEESSETTTSQTLESFTQEELEQFFSGLSGPLRDIAINKNVGKPRTRAQLNVIRGLFLGAEKFQAESDEAIWQSYEDLAILLDETGKTAETVLVFVTGGTATIVTGTAFGAARAGIDKYAEGKGAADIGQAVIVSLSIDMILQTEKLKKLSDRGNQLVDLTKRAGDLTLNQRNLSYFLRVGAKAGLYKEGEKVTKETLTKIFSYLGDTARSQRADNRNAFSITPESGAMFYTGY